MNFAVPYVAVSEVQLWVAFTSVVVQNVFKTLLGAMETPSALVRRPSGYKELDRLRHDYS